MPSNEPSTSEPPPPQTTIGAKLLNGHPQLRWESSVEPSNPVLNHSSLLVGSTGSGDEWSPNPSTNISDEEDYDRLKPDPLTLIKGSSGGGLQAQRTMNGHTQDGVEALLPERAAFEATEASDSNFTAQPSGRRKSIQVTMEKTGKKGRYILTADDPEFREILRSQIGSEADANGKERKMFRDMVFTRRFTTFDRQNPLSSESPFHGFFTLFWLSIGMMLVRIAAQNWKAYGNILGSAEVFHVMFDREIIVLGLTDGVMCAGTMFGLGLQKLILRGYLSWNRHGWIIQNLWQTFYLFAVIAWTCRCSFVSKDEIWLTIRRVPRLALESYGPCCASWSDIRHEAAFICVLQWLLYVYSSFSTYLLIVSQYHKCTAVDRFSKKSSNN